MAPTHFASRVGVKAILFISQTTQPAQATNSLSSFDDIAAILTHDVETLSLYVGPSYNDTAAAIIQAIVNQANAACPKIIRVEAFINAVAWISTPSLFTHLTALFLIAHNLSVNVALDDNGWINVNAAKDIVTSSVCLPMNALSVDVMSALRAFPGFTEFEVLPPTARFNLDDRVMASSFLRSPSAAVFHHLARVAFPLEFEIRLRELLFWAAHLPACWHIEFTVSRRAVFATYNNGIFLNALSSGLDAFPRDRLRRVTFPFQELVEMFRELLNSRRIAVYFGGQIPGVRGRTMEHVPSV